MAPRPLPSSARARRPSGRDSVRGSRKANAGGSFGQLLERVRGEVDARLSGLLDAKVAEAARHGADVEAMAAAVRDLTMRGGKRFRPGLLVAAYRAVDEDAPEEAALDAGVALELLQTYLLVHDDWMDQDDVRRGGPAVHAMLARHFGSRSVGEASAILAGDWAAALALEALSRVEAAAARVARATAMFAQIQADAVCGQQLDLAGRPDDVEAMHDLKTGSYTVRGPLLLGATLAGARPAAMRALERYARPLGIAFQLRDDLLGAFGDPAATGKPTGSDIRSGKKTMLASEALSRVSPAERRAIADTLGRRDASDESVAAVTRLYETSGARTAVERRLDELVGASIHALDGAGLSERGAAWLASAAEALTARSR